MDVLIPKNAKLPYQSEVKTYIPADPSQQSLVVDVISGEHPRPSGPYPKSLPCSPRPYCLPPSPHLYLDWQRGNKQIGELVVPVQTLYSQQANEVDVQYCMDVNGVLFVTTTSRLTGVIQKLKVSPLRAKSPSVSPPPPSLSCPLHVQRVSGVYGVRADIPVGSIV